MKYQLHSYACNMDSVADALGSQDEDLFKEILTLGVRRLEWGNAGSNGLLHISRCLWQLLFEYEVITSDDVGNGLVGYAHLYGCALEAIVLYFGEPLTADQTFGALDLPFFGKIDRIIARLLEPGERFRFDDACKRGPFVKIPCHDKRLAIGYIQRVEIAYLLGNVLTDAVVKEMAEMYSLEKDVCDTVTVVHAMLKNCQRNGEALILFTHQNP